MLTIMFVGMATIYFGVKFVTLVTRRIKEQDEEL